MQPPDANRLGFTFSAYLRVSNASNSNNRPESNNNNKQLRQLQVELVTCVEQQGLPVAFVVVMENLGYKEGSTKPRRMTRSISVVTKTEVEQPLSENNANNR